jgi:hypothetical protein
LNKLNVSEDKIDADTFISDLNAHIRFTITEGKLKQFAYLMAGTTTDSQFHCLREVSMGQ